MTKVHQLLGQKGRDVLSIHPDDSVLDAIQKMADENVGALLVIEDGKLIGLLNERLYARNVILKGRSSSDTAVRDIMETNIVYAAPDETVEECMAVMTEKRVRHLPVLDGERLIGIVSIGDLVKSIIADQKFTIEQLQHYVRG
ncbi:MAG: CBS domain-containing protein [Kiloniellaceae bacterium]